MTVFVIATLTVEDAEIASVTQACLEGLPTTKSETGCLAIDFLASATDKNKLLFLEQWQDEAAWDGHLHGPGAQAWWKNVEAHILRFEIDVIAASSVTRL